jgi:site-specific recombinase XerD
VEVSPEAVGRKLSFHTVRRTFIGTLINSGMQLISIATLLGASPKAVAEVR